jgi:hypothetical protein
MTLHMWFSSFEVMLTINADPHVLTQFHLHFL